MFSLCPLVTLGLAGISHALFKDGTHPFKGPRACGPSGKQPDATAPSAPADGGMSATFKWSAGLYTSEPRIDALDMKHMHAYKIPESNSFITECSYHSC